MIAELLEWIARLVVIMLIFRAAGRLFSGAAPRRAAGPTGRPSARAAERTGGTLVRDPQCGTYVSTARSFRVGSGDTAMYFCSADCRDAYASTHH